MGERLDFTLGSQGGPFSESITYGDLDDIRKLPQDVRKRALGQGMTWASSGLGTSGVSWSGEKHGVTA